MTDVSGRAIDPESVLEYYKRASEVGLTCSDEFHELLAILKGAAILLQGSGAPNVRIHMPLKFTHVHINVRIDQKGNDLPASVGDAGMLKTRL